MYKDNDFISEGIKIHIGAAAKQRMMAALKSDTDVSFSTSFSCLYFFLVFKVNKQKYGR